MNPLYRSVSALAVFGVLAGACYDPDLSDPNPDVDGLSLTVSADSAPADGETAVLVTVQVPGFARGDARKATLTATLGTLEGATSGSLSLVANGEGTATAELRAPTRPGMARIRATVAGVIREDSVRFTAALPTRIDVDAEKFSLKAGIGSETNVTATLRRSTGTVSSGTSVVFTATRGDNGQPIGIFSTAPPSGAGGSVKVRFSAGDTDYTGPVTITATHPETGVSGSTQLVIVK